MSVYFWFHFFVFTLAQDMFLAARIVAAFDFYVSSHSEFLVVASASCSILFLWRLAIGQSDLLSSILWCYLVTTVSSCEQIHELYIYIPHS